MIKKPSFYQLGYSQARNKPKLFFKNLPPVVFFIDLRGDSFDHRFYYQFEREIVDEEEKKQITNLILNEFKMAEKSYYGECLGFWDLQICDYCQKELLKEFSLEEYDGYGGESHYCSEGCIRMMKKEMKKIHKDDVKEWKKLRCPICKKLPDLEVKQFPISYSANLHDHHTNYKEGEETKIRICSSCHAKITLHPEKYPQLEKYLPKGTRKEMLETQKTTREKLKCKVCDKEFTDKRRVFCSENCRKVFEREEEMKKSIRKKPKRIYNYSDDSRR